MQYSIVTPFTSFVAVEHRVPGEQPLAQTPAIADVAAGFVVDLLSYMAFEEAVAEPIETITATKRTRDDVSVVAARNKVVLERSVSCDEEPSSDASCSEDECEQTSASPPPPPPPPAKPQIPKADAGEDDDTAEVEADETRSTHHSRRRRERSVVALADKLVSGKSGAKDMEKTKKEVVKAKKSEALKKVRFCRSSAFV